MQQCTAQLKEQCANLDQKIAGLSAQLLELKSAQASPTKTEPAQLDSHRSASGTAAFAMEEVEAMREELKQVSDHCNQTQGEIAEMKTLVSLNKSNSERQLNSLRTQVGELQKQVIDAQFDSGKNKQFLEDQLTELTRGAESLQKRIIAAEETQKKADTLMQTDLDELKQSCER